MKVISTYRGLCVTIRHLSFIASMSPTDNSNIKTTYLLSMLCSQVFMILSQIVIDVEFLLSSIPQ